MGIHNHKLNYKIIIIKGTYYDAFVTVILLCYYAVAPALGIYWVLLLVTIYISTIVFI